jgi:hypothetical protein
MESTFNKPELEKLYIRESLSSVEIASRLRKSIGSVHSALKRFGIPRRSLVEAAQLRRSHTYQQNWVKFSKYYEEGRNLEDISREVGCSLATTAKHLRAVGANIRPRGTESPLHPNLRSRIEFDVDAAIKMNQDGATLTEISSRLPEHPSVQVLSMRFQKVGHRVLVHKASKDQFRNLEAKKRAVAHAIGADHCLICHETRGTQLCHIQARRKGGPLNPDNSVPLCPNHHWFFDRGQLTKAEAKKIRPALLSAKRKGYTHHVYVV